MTLGVETPFRIVSGDGVSVTFAPGFTWSAASDVVATVGGVPAAFTLVAGNVVFASAPPVGTANVVIKRVTPRNQQTTFTYNGAFSSAALGVGLDRLGRQVQEIGAAVDRALVVPMGETPAALPPAASRALTLLGFDATGAAITLPIAGNYAAPTVELPSVVGPLGLIYATISGAVMFVTTKDYYGDGLEIRAAARWQRSPVQAAGNGRRQSADGAWWQIAECVIDYRMLGGRASDRTTNSAAAINEALAFANGQYPGNPFSGGRKVVIGAPAQIVAYPAYSGAACVASQIVVGPGQTLEIEVGAEVLALNTFAAAGGAPNALVTTAYTGNWQALNTAIIVNGTLNCNSVTNGIILGSGANIVVDTRQGQVTNVLKFGVQAGDPTSGTYTVFQCLFLLGSLYTTPVATYAAAQTANDPASIGIWLTSKSSDNRILGGVPIGFRTGYQDDGADNDMSWVHPFSNGGGARWFGPMVTAFQLNGANALITGIEADTPTAMGNPGITATYGLVFGSAATGYKVKGYQCFLNFDDPGSNTHFSDGLCSALYWSAADQSGSNSVDGALIDSASTSIRYNWGVNGSGGVSFFVRTGVTYSGRARFVGGPSGDGRGALNRPNITSTITAYRQHNWLDNSAFDIWQRGTGPIDCSAASTLVPTADRWLSFADGTAGATTRSVQRYTQTPAEAGSYNTMAASYAMQINAAGSATGSYWHIEQKFPLSYLQAFSQKRMTLQLAQKLISGALPAGIKVGLRQNFGTGGSPSADVFTEYATVAPGGSFGRQYITVTWPSIAGATLGTNGDGFASIYLALPITGTWSIAVTELSLTEGVEQTLYDYPDPAAELAKAQRYYEQVAIQSANGVRWASCQPKAHVPTASSSVGSVANTTANGTELTHTASVAATVTFTASEP